MAHSNWLYTLALANIPKIGNVITRQLVSYFSTAELAFEAPKGKLLKIPGIGEQTAELIIGHKAQALEKAKVSLEKLEKSGGTLLLLGTEGYPDRLQRENDAPLFFTSETF